MVDLQLSKPEGTSERPSSEASHRVKTEMMDTRTDKLDGQTKVEQDGCWQRLEGFL